MRINIWANHNAFYTFLYSTKTAADRRMCLYVRHWLCEKEKMQKVRNEVSPARTNNCSSEKTDWVTETAKRYKVHYQTLQYINSHSELSFVCSLPCGIFKGADESKERSIEILPDASNKMETDSDGIGNKVAEVGPTCTSSPLSVCLCPCMPSFCLSVSMYLPRSYSGV